MHDALVKLGLSQTEAEIYLQLIKKGAMTAVDISKEIKIHRRTIYDNLNILINKGLATQFVKDNVRFFQAANPHVLQEIEEEKISILDSILPTLTTHYSSAKPNPNVSVMKGSQTAKAILPELLQAKGEILWMGGGFQILDSLGYSKEFILTKIAKLNLKMLQPKPHTNEFQRYFANASLRYLPKKYQSQTSFIVYGNTVAIGTLVHGDIFVIRIEDDDIAQAYKNYFEIMWNATDKPS